MNKFAISLILTSIMACSAAEAQTAPGYPLPSYNTEVGVHQRCPTDIVVWLDRGTGVYYFKGQHNYGQTKGGAYICQGAALKMGAQPVKSTGYGLP